MKALRKVLCGSSAKNCENCSGPIPNGMFERELGAEHVAAEAAVAPDVVALVERGALLEQVGDLVDRQQRRDERGDHHKRRERDQDDANALVRRSAGDEGQDHQQRPPRSANWPQAAREKESSRAASITSSVNVLRMTRRPASMRWNTSSRRQHQERAEHVRIVEGAARAAVEQEQVGERRRTGGNRRRSRRARRSAPLPDSRASAARAAAAYWRRASRHRRSRWSARKAETSTQITGLVWSLTCTHRDRIADVQENEQQHAAASAPRAATGRSAANRKIVSSADDLVGARLDEDEGAGRSRSARAARRAATRWRGGGPATAVVQAAA